MTIVTESPFVVLVDSAEQLPYTWPNLRADVDEGGGLIYVHRRTENIKPGDYSIDGYQKMVKVERKTKSDLFGTLTAGRRRFVKEMQAFREYDIAWIVIEAEPHELFLGSPWAPNAKPRSIIRTWMSWTLKYPNVHWSCWPGRDVAENVTYQLLRMWWKKRVEEPRRESARREAEAWRLATGSGSARAAGPRAKGRPRTDG